MIALRRGAVALGVVATLAISWVTIVGKERRHGTPEPVLFALGIGRLPAVQGVAVAWPELAPDQALTVDPSRVVVHLHPDPDVLDQSAGSRQLRLWAVDWRDLAGELARCPAPPGAAWARVDVPAVGRAHLAGWAGSDRAPLPDTCP